jgi:hypothetical protein
MHDYARLRQEFGSRVSQTIDSPITILEFWELGDAFAALLTVLVLGVIFYAWGAMFLVLSLQLFVWPLIRRRFPNDILLHYPYRRFHVSLPGLINPRGRRRFSD